MFAKIVVKQGKNIIELNKENKALYEENKELRSENEELNLAVYNYRIDNKEMFKKLSLVADLVESFDYKKSNSVSVIRQIKEVIISDQTK